MRRGFYFGVTIGDAMRRLFLFVALTMALAVLLTAQQPDSNNPPKPQGTPRNPNPPIGLPAPLPDDAKVDPRPSGEGTEAAVRKEDKQPSPSAVKRVLRRATPNCINGVFDSCWSNSAQEEKAQEKIKKKDALRQQCKELRAAKRDAGAELDTSAEDACSTEALNESAHNLEVGDTYFGEKSYAAAENRYRLALQSNPANAVAMLHLAQVFERTGHNAEAYEQYQNFLNTDPKGPDEKKARAAMERLRKYWDGAPAPVSSSKGSDSEK